MRLFGSDKLMTVFNTIGVPENEQIQHGMLTKAIEKAQQKIEGNNFGMRKNLLEYDQVMNEQRELIYAERERVLNGESMKDVLHKMLLKQVDNAVDTVLSDEVKKTEWDANEFNQLLCPIIPVTPLTQEKLVSYKNKEDVRQDMYKQAEAIYTEKENLLPEIEKFRELERVVLLKVIDRKWMNHIDDMEQLRQSIGLVAYSQKDPVVEYKMAGYDMFDAMSDAIAEDAVRLLCHVRVQEKVEREEVAQVTGTNKDTTLAKTPKQRSDVKVYPNDPCPCGSGKKYKQCCGRNA